ncbi:MAG: hypothetical protein GWP06_06190 [Actinobacteria bacterium]|nr:hypothetical protein [Actinomycetota bacterium]
MMSKTNYITRLIILISLTLSFEMLGLPQPITGPLVNLMLILTTLVLNPLAGVILGSISPLVAVIRGQLPAILLPMVPFIIIANALFVLIFGLTGKLFPFSLDHDSSPLKSIGNWLGLLLGATIKFLWLYASASFVVPLILGKQLPAPFIAMMAIPQFITAIIGGIFALLIFSMLRGIIAKND